jgi:hypothetical protein
VYFPHHGEPTGEEFDTKKHASPKHENTKHKTTGPDMQTISGIHGENNHECLMKLLLHCSSGGLAPCQYLLFMCAMVERSYMNPNSKHYGMMPPSL